MARGIFLIQGDGQLVEMKEHRYDSEDLLQGLLANYPNLMVGDQINPGQPRRWLLVTREASVPSEEGGSGRWSVDNLFLDQDATPTIVEVKRSTDTRIRREVVGQMLDYAANAVLYWPVENLREQFAVSCKSRGVNPEQELLSFLGGETDPELFWQQVRTNLEERKVRLIFVADVIPEELQRVVEFLNEQMDRVEVLALEIKQYVGEGQRTLVPQVVGQTARARQRKVGMTATTNIADEKELINGIAIKSPAEADVARKIIEWAKPQTTPDPNPKSIKFMLARGDSKIPLFSLYLQGYIEFQVRAYSQFPPFDSVEMQRELLNRLGAVGGRTFSDDAKFPSFYLAPLTDDEKLTELFAVLDWLIRLLGDAQTE